MLNDKSLNIVTAVDFYTLKPRTIFISYLKLMEKNAGNLEAENRKLKARQAELTSKFCDEREMVKYLHSVIKNYESLLRHEPGSPRSRTRSGGHVRNCTKTESVMEISSQGENLLKLNESSFPKACVRPQEDDMLVDEHQSKRVSEFQHRLKAHETAMAMARSLIYSSTDEVSSSEGEMLNASGLESDFDTSFELTDDLKQIASKKDQEPGAAVTIFPAFTRQTYQVTQSKQGVLDSSSRKQTLKEMKELVDALLQKANKYEKRVRRKDSEMKRLEIKFDYLESIAFGEESECL